MLGATSKCFSMGEPMYMSPYNLPALLSGKELYPTATTPLSVTPAASCNEHSMNTSLCMSMADTPFSTCDIFCTLEDWSKDQMRLPYVFLPPVVHLKY